jgi:hypothetical protein
MKSILRALAAAAVFAICTTAVADERSVPLGGWLYQRSGVASFDVMQVLACHSKTQSLTILHRRQQGYRGYESAFDISVGDTFVIYDEDWKPVTATLRSLANCVGKFVW